MDTLPFSQRRCQIGAIVVLAAVIALPPVWIEAQQSRQAAMTIEALAAKVKQLEDTKEITDVLIAYGTALDSRYFTAYSSLFAKDGSWSGGMGSVSGGPKAILRLHDQPYWRRRVGDRRWPAGDDLPHHVELQDRRERRHGDGCFAVDVRQRRARPGHPDRRPLRRHIGP